MSKVRVNLKERSYDILIGQGRLSRLPRLVKGRRVVIITGFQGLDPDGNVLDITGNLKEWRGVSL